MKVLIVFNRYEYRGGEDTYVGNLVRLLKTHGHTVKVYEKDSRSIRSWGDKLRVALHLFWNPAGEKEFEEVIRAFRPQVVHFHNIVPLIPPTVYPLCKRYGIRTVQTIHNYKHLCPKNDLFRHGAICTLCINNKTLINSVRYGCYHSSRAASFFYALSYHLHVLFGRFKAIDRFIFPSPFTMQLYKKHARLDESRFTYVPYLMYAGISGKHGKKSIPYFLFAGRLTEEKGILGLVEYFSKEPGQKLVIVGEGPLRRTVVEKIKEIPNIHYLGQKNATTVRTLMRNSSGVIVPSQWYEVLPNVILEAITVRAQVWVPAGNRNLARLKSQSTNIHTYRSRSDLFNQLLHVTPVNKGHHTPLEKMIEPEFHYRKLMEIYSRK